VKNRLLAFRGPNQLPTELEKPDLSSGRVFCFERPQTLPPPAREASVSEPRSSFHLSFVATHAKIVSAAKRWRNGLDSKDREKVVHDLEGSGAGQEKKEILRTGGNW
jgi:hypothetical protein